MLDVGFSELLLIVVAAILFIGPKDYPVIIRRVSGFIREFRSILNGLKAQATQLMDESGLQELRQQTRTITDLDGKPQAAYDVRELEQLRSPAKPLKEYDA